MITKKKSNNRAKMKDRRARIHAKVADRRRDWLHTGEPEYPAVKQVPAGSAA